jgi:hypothetical protein
VRAWGVGREENRKRGRRGKEIERYIGRGKRARTAAKDKERKE